MVKKIAETLLWTVVAFKVTTAGAAEQLLEGPSTNISAGGLSRAPVSLAQTSPPIPTEFWWPQDDPGQSYFGLGGDLYLGRDGRVVRQVPVLNATTPDGRQGWTWVDTGQRVKIILRRNPANQFGAFLLLIVGVGMVVFGAVGLFKPDWAWKQRQSEAAGEGMRAERTPEWESSNLKQQLATIIAGLILAGAGLSIFGSS